MKMFILVLVQPQLNTANGFYFKHAHLQKVTILIQRCTEEIHIRQGDSQIWNSLYSQSLYIFINLVIALGIAQHLPAVVPVSKVCVPQGLVSNLILGKDVLTEWKIYPLNIDGAVNSGWPHSDSQISDLEPQKEPSAGPVFYMGTLQANGLALDTFLKLNEWTKVMYIFVSDILIHVWVHFLVPWIKKIFLLISFSFTVSGSGLDKWYECGTVLASQRPSTDSLYPWTSAQHHPAQQHHSAGAGRGPSTPSCSLHGPASAQSHCWEVLTESTEEILECICIFFKI